MPSISSYGKSVRIGAFSLQKGPKISFVVSPLPENVPFSSLETEPKAIRENADKEVLSENFFDP